MAAVRIRLNRKKEKNKPWSGSLSKFRPQLTFREKRQEGISPLPEFFQNKTKSDGILFVLP